METISPCSGQAYLPQSVKFPAQGYSFNEAEQLNDAPVDNDEPETKTIIYTLKRGRKPSNLDLSREVIEHDLPDSEKVCDCYQSSLQAIGVETSDQLEIIPKQLKVLRHEPKKYACRHCEQQRTGSKVVNQQPLPGNIATAGILATFAVSKYVDGFRSSYRKRAVPSGLRYPTYHSGELDDQNCRTLVSHLLMPCTKLY
ncbi:IS66 family transposase zinc-finger binding domain-containing protein [Vibrio alginolyticus]